MTTRLVLTSLLALAACSPSENNPVLCPEGATCGTPMDAGNDLGAVDVRTSPADVTDVGDGSLAPRDTGPVVSREVVSMTIEPASPTLTTRYGIAATQDFTAVGILRDGSRVNLANVVWAATPTDSPAGALGAESGRFTATGTSGASFAVTATFTRAGMAPLTASARLDVRVERESTAMGTTAPTPMESMRFWAAPRVSDASRAVRVLYPLEQAVMPANVPAPDVQWEGGAEGELMLVRLTKPHVEVRGWVRHTGAEFRYGWPVDGDGWRALLESDADVPLTVVVDRFDSARNEVVPSAPVTVRIARATLSGTIYYWDLSEGRIMKLDAITGARSLTVPNPPRNPADGSRCVACHTISRDGRYMSTELWGGDQPSAIFDLSASTITADPAPTLFTPGPRYLFSTFSPDGRYLVANRGNQLRLIARDTGVTIDGSNLPDSRAAHPDWSPDGAHVAYVANTNGTWGVDFSAGDLAVVDRVSETLFGAPRIIHRGASTPERPADAHPSFAPDSRWVAFQHGTNSRGARAEGSTTIGYPGRLEMVAADGAETQSAIVLQRASGGGFDSYWPNFSPFNSGGYFWLAFYSRRDYGNAQAGTRGTGRRQIWVTAVSNRPTAGEDPSSVPYWLPGQETRVDNMSAQWAPVACRTNGETCSVSAECCSGVCQRGTDGTFRCATPTMTECRRAGRTCSTSDECCTGLTCFANVCGLPPG